MEFGMYLTGLGILSMFGASVLLFYTGMQLKNAAEVYHNTMEAIADLRSNTAKEHEQIQNWIIDTNVAVESSETKSAGVREFCAKGYLDMEKKVKKIEETFEELGNTTRYTN
jgi:hypothetical protein